jgi:alginate O-acetyltransferase complex protein AlgI
MNFLSLTYGLFLLSLVGVFWSLKWLQIRLAVLLLASLLFYASLQLQYVPLLLVATWINFQLGRAIGVPAESSTNEQQYAQQDWNRKRLLWLGFGIVLNGVLLLSFKYVPFFLDTVRAVFGVSRSIAAPGESFSFIAPLGLSFYCFESIAYLVDVYRGAPAAQGFLRFSAYKLFFAKLLSGPITRYHLFARQILQLKFPSVMQIADALWLIACGAIKKGLIADRLGEYVNLSFDNLTRAGSGDIWLATITYGFQIYLDFSGYVDLARGSALLLGFDLPQNFDFPYFTTSIAQFWRRWHMTLGDWLRNYLYFPLGGSRRALGRTCLNLMIVMLVAGLWHGAAWGFVLWGGWHGLALVVHRLVDVLAQRWMRLARFWATLPGQVVAWFSTQAAVFLAWILFRLPNWSQAELAFRKLWGTPADPQFTAKVYGEALQLDPTQIAGLLGLLSLGMGLSYLVQRQLKVQLIWYLKLMLVPICLYAVWLFAPDGGARYIYFDF